MTKTPRLSSLLHRLGVSGPARVRASKGSSTSFTSLTKLVQLRSLTLAPLVTLMVLSGLAFAATSASAATAGPGFTLDSVAAPTNFFSSATENTECIKEIEKEEEHPPCDAYEVSAMNAGSEPTKSGSPVTLTDTLPEGVTVRSVLLYLVKTKQGAEITGRTIKQEAEDCSGSGYPSPSESVVQCTFPGAIPPDDQLKMVVYVTVNSGVAEGSRLTNKATVSGGGAPTVSTEQTNEVNSATGPFGPANFGFYKDALNGTEETQAGGHPYELTTTIDLDSALRNEIGKGPGKQQGLPSSVEEVKDIVVDLPLGFAGSALAAPQCTEAQLDSKDHCPPETVVGHLTSEPVAGPIGGTTINGPIWNIVPERGHPAEFGYIDDAHTTHIAGYVSVVPTPAGYVLQFVASDLPEVILNRIVVTFYGDPAKRDGTGAAQVPFFTNPTDCSGQSQVAKIWIDSWAHPAQFQPGSGGLIPANLDEEVDGKKLWAEKESVSPPVTGCNALQFTPAIGAQPTTHEADKPSGLEFEQRLAQSEIFGTDATPALKNTTITFPAGMTVDPSSADGLGTCSNAQIGWTGPTLFDFTQAPPECPESSKIGSLELETPLIPGILHGEVFLAAQNANPFGSTFATYIVVNDPVTGVVLKLAGELKSNAATGQLIAEFDETPQLPFSALRVHFFGGPRASLATPPDCGIYTTNSELTPWSAPDSGPSGTPFDSYTIDENCAIGFAPAFTGGATNLQAGAYTTFQASFERQDSDQELGGAEVNLPPGMLADVPSVTECGEAELRAEEADAPTGGCPASSKVGTVEAGAGPGPNPLFVPGNVFWTGPHNGGPFGLAVVVSANPGPFHFGNVVVRQSIRVNPLTAAVTDVSDAFPTYLDPRGPNGQVSGIPIKLRRVDIEINRPGFTFNPTNCAKGTFQVGGKITSTQGASKALATPFQVTNCATLKFAPKFNVSTAGHTSKALGASLTAKVSIPSAAQGTYANIARVKVDLPLQLPSQLKTLQKACLAKTFEEGFEKCLTQAPDSKIGEAVVHTPILGVPLSGPAIFVSHGGEAFPSLTIVLQGDGITIDLVGSTFIHGGITSTTFKTVPDTPFSTFELTIPQGKYAALAANLPEKDHGNLCGQNLKMPTEFLAQNGAKINEDTQIAISGCPKVKALTRAQKLSKALKACKKKAKGKRSKCEAAARKSYGPVKKKRGK
jgi:hypothetical protein